MSELLFECYRVPSVCYGVDGLFSFRHSHPKCSAALIINCGYHTTHILPVINNQVDPTRSRRINVGGIHIINYLHRLLQLKYPAHFTAITPSRAEVCESYIYLRHVFSIFPPLTSQGHVKWSPCHHGMVHPQIADGWDGLQIWRVAADIIYKHSGVILQLRGWAWD
jgi:hypothetical protein